MRFLIFSLIIAFLFILLGITGGKVRNLSARISLLKSQGAKFEKDLGLAIAENAIHISRLQDYQSVLYVAQGSNTALSKRLLMQEQDIEKLQTNLASVLRENYIRKDIWDKERRILQDEKKKLRAEFQALSQALFSQSKELAKIGEDYRSLRVKYEESRKDSSELLKANQIKEVTIVELQMSMKKLQMNNKLLSARLNFSGKGSTIFSSQNEKPVEQLSELRSVCDGNDFFNGQVDKSLP